MNSFLILIIVALIAALSAYLINQLPAISDFPSRNVYLWRLLGCAVALSIIVSALNDEELAQKFSWLKTVALLIGLFMVVDGLQMAWAIRKHTQSIQIATEDDSKRRELLKVSAEDIHRRQQENLKNLGVIIPLKMRDEPQQVVDVLSALKCGDS